MVEMQLICILILLIFSFCVQGAKAEPVPQIKGNWNLILNEEFNNFDLNHWSAGLFNKSLRLGDSKCFYLPKNVKVEKGKLEIYAREDKLKRKDKHGKKRKANYSCGAVHSFGKFAQRYGYFEARVKLPKAEGLWPAFWLLPDRSSEGIDLTTPRLRSTFWETGPHRKGFITGKGMEIDIFEHLTEWGAGEYHLAAHWDGTKDKHQKFSKRYSEGESTKKGFRNIGLYWEPGLLVWYIDGKEMGNFKNDRVADVPMFVLLTMQMGGWATDDIEDEKLPDKMLVDHLRIWSGKRVL